jgi:hypothetical protein
MDLTTREICEDALELEQTPLNEIDLPPEYCHYKDEGCEYARACLECPFPRCLYDEARGRQRWLKELRDREILRLFGAGRKVNELAALFDVSERTVQRAIKSNT